MATEQADTGEMEKQQQKAGDDVVSIDLPAPQGWTKKFIPRKGRTPRRNEIIFISPTGEEIKNKRQLDQYLKSHPGGPSSSEFEWGTGDNPRRSARLSGKSKATYTPESGSSQKRQRKSSSKEAEDKKRDTDEEGEASQDETAPTEAAEETTDRTEVEMKGEAAHDETAATEAAEETKDRTEVEMTVEAAQDQTAPTEAAEETKDRTEVEMKVETAQDETAPTEAKLDTKDKAEVEKKDAVDEENHAEGDKTKDAAQGKKDHAQGDKTEGIEDAKNRREGDENEYPGAAEGHILGREAKLAASDPDGMEESNQKFEEKTDEMSCDKPQSQEADAVTLPCINQPAEHEQEAGKKPDFAEVMHEVPVPADTLSLMEEKDVKQGIPSEAASNAEKAASEELAKDTECISNSQAALRHAGSHSVSHEDASQESNGPPVRC
ncbi:hypothetical protein Nepgr_012987 [Nepenthes gracilis]|uniref:MBD domain-containing protein n=1 Tax=Nepenthes gracilis TaxID=150966 RepID=A0AAD3XNV8_NEPGR|nr:hypothetical protein Nepgr_012987 [Nepenthes gracilis]